VYPVFLSLPFSLSVKVSAGNLAALFRGKKGFFPAKKREVSGEIIQHKSNLELSSSVHRKGKRLVVKGAPKARRTLQAHSRVFV
jgi:hypothetical protein